jgi:hypothetical protein
METNFSCSELGNSIDFSRIGGGVCSLVKSLREGPGVGKAVDSNDMETPVCYLVARRWDGRLSRRLKRCVRALVWR